MAFNVDRRLQGGWEVVELQDDRSGSYVEIIPSAGAMLNAWKLKNKGATINIIDGYSGSEDFRLNVHSGFKSAKLSPFVCRLKDAAYEWESVTYQVQKFMLNNDALHGILYDAPFSIIDESISDEQCSVSLLYQYPGNIPGFPFPYHCLVRYTLEEGNSIHIETEITNPDNGTSSIPVADGWHPYFTLGGKVDDWWLKIASDQMLEYDESLIPTGRIIVNPAFREGRLVGDTRLDNGFLLEKNASPFCVLSNPANGLAVEFISERNYPYLQLYIPDHRKSIAIENLSSAPDAFNNGMGLIILRPGDEISFETVIRITPSAM